jgi:hypothetical protein
VCRSPVDQLEPKHEIHDLGHNIYSDLNVGLAQG